MIQLPDVDESVLLIISSLGLNPQYWNAPVEAEPVPEYGPPNAL